MNSDLVTLARHSIALQKENPEASGDFTLLMASIQLGCKFVASNVRKAGLANLTGLAGCKNITGDDQKKLDLIADDVFVNSLKSSGKVSVLVSEEREEAIIIEGEQSGNYAVVFDPLDGSSNIDCGVSIGTIFGIYRSDRPSYSNKDVLRPGREMVAAGYALYGSSTQLVVSYGKGVHCYTLDPSLGEFILTQENIVIPERATIYSVNEGNSSLWDKQTCAFVLSRKSPLKGRKPYSLRYIGSMVADIHRTLLYGGVFLYPRDSKNPAGKLRLLYECFPMAFLIEAAGGRATDGKDNILDIIPTSIHQRSPICIGSRLDVSELATLYIEMDQI
ncbi:uncharacterized protein LOC135122039 [Zophobas morio]|uniref:uncharacterized protein LOC135122039 n=1 Tax=Zophobas morio TaxID=2755281 RepID=UPI003082BF47